MPLLLNEKDVIYRYCLYDVKGKLLRIARLVVLIHKVVSYSCQATSTRNP